jgi:flagellar motor switch/type III secretory pathway protein FliN
MATAPIAAVTSLPKRDEARAAAGNALLRLLGNGDFNVALIDGQEVQGHAFRAGDGKAYQLAGLRGADTGVDALCDALDASDGLLRHVEHSLGITLDPLAFSPAAATAFDDDAAYVFSLSDDAQSVLFAILADAETAQSWAGRAEALPVDLATILLLVKLSCIAARLPLEHAAGIGAGDLLLLPHRLIATLATANGQIEQGHFETASGNWRSGGFAEAEDQMADDIDGLETGDLNGRGGFTVPVTLHLPEQAVNAATLSALAPGMVIALSPLVQGLQVDLLIGGRRIARGEIVEMGENFAVHIDESFSSGPTPQYDDGED